MTKDRRQKRAARALSKITGIRYTAARRAVAGGGSPRAVSDPAGGGWGEPVPDDGFRRLDELVRGLKVLADVHLLDVGTLTIELFGRDGDVDDVVEVTVNVRGVILKAWYDGYDDDRCLQAYTEDEDTIDVIDHIEEGDNTDDLYGLLDEVEWFWQRHGYAGLSQYKDHLRRSS